MKSKLSLPLTCALLLIAGIGNAQNNVGQWDLSSWNGTTSSPTTTLYSNGAISVGATLSISNSLAGPGFSNISVSNTGNPTYLHNFAWWNAPASSPVMTAGQSITTHLQFSQAIDFGSASGQNAGFYFTDVNNGLFPFLGSNLQHTITLNGGGVFTAFAAGYGGNNFTIGGVGTNVVTANGKYTNSNTIFELTTISGAVSSIDIVSYAAANLPTGYEVGTTAGIEFGGTNAVPAPEPSGVVLLGITGLLIIMRRRNRC